MRRHIKLILVSGLALILCFVALAAAAPLKVGDGVGNLKFAPPISEADQKYLGLEHSGAFSLKDIKAAYVVLEVMRTSCPHCGEQIGAMNKLFALVEKSELNDKVKFLAVGESDSQASLLKYQKANKIPFAMVPDPDWLIGDAVQLTGTPTTLVLDNRGKVVWLHDGVFGNAASVFQVLKTKVK